MPARAANGVSFLCLVLCLAAVPSSTRAQTTGRSALTGVVLTEDGRPIGAASVTVARTDGAAPSGESLTDSAGAFRVGPLTAGVYRVTVRRLGYRSAELPALRLAVGETRSVRVTLTQAPRQLSTVVVVTSPAAVDVGTPELPAHFDRTAASLLPTGRNASSLVALVPGSHRDALWGAASTAANNYKLDGVSINHPGSGGDFLLLSVDWIEALEVRGLAAGAEHGNFQGGSINAITRSGSNVRRAALRVSYESPRLTATNLDLNEEGSEQAGRREINGEVLGPLACDRLFYFAAGQLVDRDVRAPSLATPAPRDFQSVQEEHRTGRGLVKLTWLPAAGDRVDVLAGRSGARVEHHGVNGIDDDAATRRVSAPATFYEAAWTRARSARATLDVRIAGFTGHESRRGYAGPSVPAVQILQLGRQPVYQNAAFDERLEPSSIGGNVTWRGWRHVLGADHQLVLGAELGRGSWRESRTRNGGVTWRPYTSSITGTFDPANTATWQATGSDWGGEMRLDSDVASGAAFIQDYVTIGTRLTVTPGLRYGRWAGWLTPACVTSGSATGGCPPRFRAVHDDAIDPRIGAVWDVTGRSTLALKAHWGRYHQGMFTLFFDRAEGAGVYTNHRFYYAAPPLTHARTTFTPEQRDALTGPGGFSPFYDEEILDESGRVEGYRQPYVDQTVLGVEKTLGPGWKVALLYTHRRNGDIVGLVDRNRARNYSVIRNVKVEHRLGFGRILDANGRELVLPEVYVSNGDLKAALIDLAPMGPGSGRIAGFTFAEIEGLFYQPDVVLAAIPEARRRYDQLTLWLRADHASWRADGSLTAARLRGNVAGVTGHGTAGTRFSAGPFVRPNEAINFYGALPDATEFEGKLWLTARLPHALHGGIFLTHVLGERTTPTFRIAGHYRYIDATGADLPSDYIFRQILGQTVFVEPRGSRSYASRTNLDAHLEWRAPGRARLVVAADVFNVLGSNAIVSVKTAIDDQVIADPTSRLGATRLRVPPRTVRLGVRVE
ncbi:MAG: TonB-dependent receptor domain-containing protein [Gemmatimonadaceae bacterium]